MKVQAWFKAQVKSPLLQTNAFFAASDHSWIFVWFLPPEIYTKISFEIKIPSDLAAIVGL